MAAMIYLLCAATALASAGLLLRSYQRTRHRLLLWSGLCFAGMFLNNIVLILDRLVFPEADLLTWRLSLALLALIPMLYGLIWEDD